MRRRIPIVLLAGLLVSCGAGERRDGASIEPLAVPATAGSRFPSIAPVAEGGLAMVWLEVEASAPARLLGARYDGRDWSEPRTIIEDERLFVNWADFPAVVGLDNGGLAVCWLRRDGGRSHAYGIRFSLLAPDWQQRQTPLRPHLDRSETEHGFVSMIPEEDGRVGLVWLDGRKMQGPAGTMQLLYRSWSPDGLSPETILDPDVCTCCQTGAVLVEGEPFVVYRDHAEGEVRDIAFVRRRGGSWSAPRPLHRDGWKIAGCPVNGPAVDARERRVGVAWYTRAADRPRVLVALSGDGGASFAEPVQLDDGDPLGRVDIEMLDDGTVVVIWLEKVEGGAEIRLRSLDPASGPGESVTVAPTRALRDSGFPRLARAADRLFVTWTDPSSPPQVKLARIDL